jgi:alpha-L-arabinofuranosidase
MSSPLATLVFDRDFAVGQTDPRLFGSFIEHLGRCVYTGIYEPGHPTADGQGFRRDVLELVRELGVTLVRYPGGNFVSGYRWEDGVGPRDLRPTRRDLAWTSTESNHIGTNEFVDWCRLAGVEPMMAVNLGTRGAQEAADLVEYCNHPGGTALSQLRREHGWKQPHEISLWCLGNEMDGPWQIGQKSAHDYGMLARETAKMMRTPDSNRSSTDFRPMELVACGSSQYGMPSFGAWEREMLQECYDQVDYVSLHTYAKVELDAPGKALAKGDEMDRFIKGVAAICDAVGAEKRSPKQVHLSFDEWNVWYHTAADVANKRPAWTAAPPLLEQNYHFLDALTFGSMALALLRNADRVKIGCQAQLVNVIGLIFTRENGPAWRQSIYWPFLHFARYGRGRVLREAAVTGPSYQFAGSKGMETASGLQSVAVATEEGGVNLFALNRLTDQSIDLEADLRSFPRLMVAEWHQMAGHDLAASNTEAHPDRVSPQLVGGARLDGARLTATLPPLSWNVIRLVPA